MSVPSAWQSARETLRHVESVARGAVPRPIWRLLGYLPLTVALIALPSWAFMEWGITIHDVLGPSFNRLHPLFIVLGMVFHADWGHFVGNMYILVPFGVILTWLTSNRHVLLITIVPHALMAIQYGIVVRGIGVGSSGVAFAYVAAVLVHAVGMTVRNASTETLIASIVGVFTPCLVGVFLIVLMAGGDTGVAHVGHFLAFFYGGLIEAVAVVSAHEGGATTRVHFNPGL